MRWRTRSLTTNAVRLSAADLQAQGFFHPDRPQRSSWCVDEPHYRLDCDWSAEGPHLRVSLLYDGYPIQMFDPKLSWSTRGLVYFICPVRRTRVHTLYLFRGLLACRQAHALAYPCQTISPTFEPARKALGYSKESVWNYPTPQRPHIGPEQRCKEPDWDMRRHEQELRASSRACQEAHEAIAYRSDTEAAIYRAGKGPVRWTEQVEALLWQAHHKADGVQVISSNSPYAPLSPDLPLTILENQPRIDLRVLAREGYVRRGEQTLLSLNWGAWGLETVYVCLDLRTSHAPRAELIYRSPAGAVVQVVALTASDGTTRHRHAFKLQGSGPTEVLAYRAGRFAPRKLQRMVNRSQRVGGYVEETPHNMIGYEAMRRRALEL